jgi:hypothetical protein
MLMAAHGKLKLPAGETVAFLHAVTEFMMVVLVTLGVAGTAYMLVSADGWLGGIFSRSTAGGVAAVFSILIVAFSCWLLRHWLSARARRVVPEFFAYGLAAAGLFYAAQMYTKGTL